MLNFASPRVRYVLVLSLSHIAKIHKILIKQIIFSKKDKKGADKCPLPLVPQLNTPMQLVVLRI